MAELSAAGRHIDIREVAGHGGSLFGLTAEGVGIQQQGMLIRTSDGNLLFDVPGHIDDAAVARVRQLGGIAGIVASHPHMYGVQSCWSAAFDDAPIWVAEVDEQWLGHRPPAVRTWREPFDVLAGITLDQIGGHFPGSTIAHWPDGDQGRGILFAGDAIVPVADGMVTFLRSYPNSIPMSAAVRPSPCRAGVTLRIRHALQQFRPLSRSRCARDRAAQRRTLCRLGVRRPRPPHLACPHNKSTSRAARGIHHAIARTKRMTSPRPQTRHVPTEPTTDRTRPTQPGRSLERQCRRRNMGRLRRGSPFG